MSTNEAECGIVQSALALLRTVEHDHSPTERVNDSYLLCHGCGDPVHVGCSNFGTDWVVRHERGEVTLSQPVHVDSLAGKTEYDISVRLPRDEYRRQIVQFAETARTFYFSAGGWRVSPGLLSHPVKEAAGGWRTEAKRP